MSAMEKKPGEKKNKQNPVVKYFKEVRSEMKKVVYPTPKQVRINTTAVIICVILIGVFITILDFGFTLARDKFLLAGTSTSQSSGNINVGGEDGAQTQVNIGQDEEGNLINTETGEILQTKEQLEEQQKAAEDNAKEGAPESGDAGEAE